MNRIILLVLISVVFISSCKKSTVSPGNNNQLYPLTTGNKWDYIDSFFNETGKFLGKDTFHLKVAKEIIFNSRAYTPLTDKYDDSIFLVSSTYTTVFMLIEKDEPLMFKWPFDEGLPVVNNSYRKDTLISSIFTILNTFTAYPSYKVLITRDDGLPLHYKQREIFFSPGLGIIKGRDILKDNAGNIYTYDAFKLITYSLN